MMRTRLAVLAIVCSLSSTVASGCRSSGAFENADPNAPIQLVVKNDNYADMDVYAVGDGLATRVGTVSGLTTRHYSLHDSFFKASDVRIVATPIGGNGRASTGPIMVSSGQTIFFTINPTLRTSSVIVQ